MLALAVSVLLASNISPAITKVSFAGFAQTTCAFQDSHKNGPGTRVLCVYSCPDGTHPTVQLTHPVQCPKTTPQK